MLSRDLVTGMGDQEICALTGRLLDNPGELAHSKLRMNIYSIPSRLPDVALWLPVVQYIPTDLLNCQGKKGWL